MLERAMLRAEIVLSMQSLVPVDSYYSHGSSMPNEHAHPASSKGPGSSQHRVQHRLPLPGVADDVSNRYAANFYLVELERPFVTSPPMRIRAGQRSIDTSHQDHNNELH